MEQGSLSPQYTTAWRGEGACLAWRCYSEGQAAAPDLEGGQGFKAEAVGLRSRGDSGLGSG